MPRLTKEDIQGHVEWLSVFHSPEEMMTYVDELMDKVASDTSGVAVHLFTQPHYSSFWTVGEVPNLHRSFMRMKFVFSRKIPLILHS